MYLHLGRDVLVPGESIVGVFDLDNTTYCRAAGAYLAAAERDGRVVNVSDDLPRSAVLCREGGKTSVYISQLAPGTLVKRLENNGQEY